MLGELFQALKETIKDVAEGSLLSFGSQMLDEKYKKIFEDNAEDVAIKEVIEYVSKYMKHKGSSDDPFDSQEVTILTTTFAFFKSHHIYSGKDQLVDALVEKGHDIYGLKELS